MTTRPEKLAAVPEGGLDTNAAVVVSSGLDGATNPEKERPKKSQSSLNPKISTTITSAVVTTTTTTTAGTSATGTSTTSGANNKTGVKASTAPPSSTTNNLLPKAAREFLPRDASSRTDGGGGAGGESRLQKRWAVEEEKKLVSAVETFGTVDWAKIAANFPERNERQCRSKWRYLSKKAAATSSGAWTVEEEKFGTVNWTKVAANVPGRIENHCRKKWQHLTKKAATTANGTWTLEEEKKLVSAVEPFGTSSWAKIAANVPGRNEKQCRHKWHTANYKSLWHTMSTKEAVPTAISHWTREEEKKLVSAEETFWHCYLG